MSSPSTENFVRYLNTYTTTTADHAAAFDEYVGQSRPPEVSALRIETDVEQLVGRIATGANASVILTGNAGDGKTYLCRHLVGALRGSPLAEWPTETPAFTIDVPGGQLTVIKDLSEVSEREGARLLESLEVSLGDDRPSGRFVVAANEGRLRALMQNGMPRLREVVEAQLRTGPDEGGQLVLINLNRVASSEYTPQVAAWLSTPEMWGGCEGCPGGGACPLRFNASRLADDRVVRRLQELYETVEHLGDHLTVRDLLIHLAFTVTGGLTCRVVRGRAKKEGWEPERYLYHENVWGVEAPEALRRSSHVLQRLAHLDPGSSSIFDVDDAVINRDVRRDAGATECRRLFEDKTVPGHGAFERDRRAYLLGDLGDASGRAPDLIQRLPQARRKVYFEWAEDEVPSRLLPYLFHRTYFALLEKPTLAKNFVRPLMLGLNRAFSGLFLTTDDELLVTSHFARGVEQSVPLIQVALPHHNVLLNVETPTGAPRRLVLTVYPLPRHGREAVEWPVDLLHFEFLMRRAQGATPDVLAAECDLSIRHLKDAILTRFVADGDDPDEVRFFMLQGNAYHPHTLSVHADRFAAT